MASELRIGIIGCGEIAMQTCQGIAAAPNASVAMLMDPKPELLSDLAEMFGAPTTTDVDEVLASADVDAVYIATPHNQHAPLGIRAAAAGKHVLVEKPIATTLADADALIEACREHGVTLGVAYPALVDGGMAAARDLVRGGALGEITAVRITVHADKPDSYWTGGYTRRVRTTWRTSKEEAGGGILIMNAVHDLNAVRWVTGLEVSRVYAECDTLATEVEVEDTVGAVLRYTNGAIGVIQAGSTMRGGAHDDRPGPRVYGTKGQMILTDHEPLVWLVEPLEGGVRGAWEPVRHSGPRGDRAEIVRRFAAAALAGEEPPSTGLDGRKALEIVLAAYRSGERHEPVSLPLDA